MPVLLMQGNALHIPLREQSVHMICTSPPYWGLRDYGTGTWQGGDPLCPHAPAATPSRRGLASSTLVGGTATTGHQQEGYGQQCSRCGAVRDDQQLGLEPLYSCGRMESGLRQLRKDLTPEELAYVIAELQKAGLI